MAKRKRLDTSPAAAPDATSAPEAELEAKSGYPFGVAPARTRVPIAQVAGDAAERAALDELSQEINQIRAEGRLIHALPLSRIKTDHLIRDRTHFDAEEMEALKASLKARGQQTAIEVLALEDGHYGLISGWRRVEALKSLGSETVHALIRKPEGAAEAYVAMIEENEIRAGLSFYERARLASEAAVAGVYPTPMRAIQGLFANASAPKRSKIGSFVTLYAALHNVLRFPEAIPEKLGLSLAQAIEGEAGFATRLKDLLRKSAPETAAEERAILDRALVRGGAKQEKGQGGKPAVKPAHKAAVAKVVAPGLTLERRKGALILTGASVTAELEKELARWLQSR